MYCITTITKLPTKNKREEPMDAFKISYRIRKSYEHNVINII